MSDFGRFSPVAQLPNTQTLASGYAPLITFEILSTTDWRIYLSASVGLINWTKSRISECIKRKMSLIRSVSFVNQGYLLFWLNFSIKCCSSFLFSSSEVAVAAFVVLLKSLHSVKERKSYWNSYLLGVEWSEFFACHESSDSAASWVFCCSYFWDFFSFDFRSLFSF